MSRCEIGIYGLGVMGQNLALNFARHGVAVAVFNRYAPGEETVATDFVAARCRDVNVMPTVSLAEFAATLRSPRTIVLLVQAGKVVDEVLAQLVPLLSAGDVIVDGGNSHFLDTTRREKELASAGIHFVGCGISGGAAGALRGPSLMPGGAVAGWERVRELLCLVAARDAEGQPCCTWLGGGGAGHFVKMVHNGIEYALMQLIAEGYDILRRQLMVPADEICAALEHWQTRGLGSYLLDITLKILRTRNAAGQLLVDSIRDCATGKGTGRDLAVAALLGNFPATAIGEAVNARNLSAMDDERRLWQANFPARSPAPQSGQGAGDLLAVLPDALYCANLIAYAQGLSLLVQVSRQHGWKIPPAGVARVWTRGSIIASELLDRLAASPIDSITPGGVFVDELTARQASWRRVVAGAVTAGIPVPVLAATLTYFDGLRSPRLPAGLLQAQRDFFGAHGFACVDQSGDQLCHGNWEKPFDETA